MVLVVDAPAVTKLKHTFFKGPKTSVQDQWDITWESALRNHRDQISKVSLLLLLPNSMGSISVPREKPVRIIMTWLRREVIIIVPFFADHQ